VCEINGTRSLLRGVDLGIKQLRTLRHTRVGILAKNNSRLPSSCVTSSYSLGRHSYVRGGLVKSNTLWLSVTREGG
jgi:hypothetical protein